MSSQQYKTIVRRVNEEAFSADGDLSVIDEFVDPDLIDHTAPPALQHGHQSLKQLAQIWRVAFPDLKVTIHEVMADGDLVVIAWSGGGTHLGDLMGIPPTGRSGVMSGLTFNRMHDGRIVERWGNSDQVGLFMQLGLIPAPVG
ncbi:MAG: ester cyclase [Roseiflexaceae bacterium]